MTDSPERWTVSFLREDGRKSHTLTASRPGMLAGAFAIVLAVLGSGFLAGTYFSGRTESARITRLTDEVLTLRQQNRGLAELAARLEALESDYARLRGAVTEGAPPVTPSVRLPAERDTDALTDPSLTSPAWPLAQRGFITRTYGSRDPEAGRGHTGVDIAIPTGSYVRATRTGLVEEAGEDEVYGRFVVIAHGDGVASLYGHNSWLFVQTGDSVQRLQVIALSGNTGRSTAPHLHFEVTRDGELLDPLAFVNQGGGGSGVGRAGVEQR